jgi:phosphate acetyltransferase
MNPRADFIENRTFDELLAGQQALLQRSVTADDIKAFALVSGDVNPAHVDAEYAEASRFHGVIAHGMFAGALISSVLGTEFPGPGTIYIAQSLHFHRPVRVGDRLSVQVTVIDKDAETRNVRLDCAVLNQLQQTVVSGEALVRAPTSKVLRPRADLPTLHLFDPDTRLRDWMAGLLTQATQAGQVGQAGQTGPVDPPALPCAVVHPCDALALRAALAARDQGLIVPLLVAPEARLRALAAELGLSLDGVEIVDVPHSHAAARRAAELAVHGQVQALMKGSLHTDELLGAVLAEPGLRTARRLSHVFRFEVPAYPKPLLVTDAAVNIRPSLEEKADIVRNAVDLARALGVARPKVALLSAVETVTPRLASTLDAAALCKMAERGQILHALLDGPLAFDNAISREAALLKGIDSPVAGDADVLVVPDLEAGNILAKQLEHLAGAASCGVVLGARVPIALTSRSDPVLSRVASAALARVMAQRR